ncbi:hypothetical protein OY671_011461, partial [Metschnikowia pulcherrima]
RPHAPVPRLRRPDPQEQPGAGLRVPADGGHAHRDQISHAAAAQEDGRRRRARGPTRRTGAPPHRIRADEAGSGRPGPPALAGARFPAGRGPQRPLAGRAPPRGHDRRPARGSDGHPAARQAAHPPHHQPRRALGARAHGHGAAQPAGQALCRVRRPLRRDPR